MHCCLSTLNITLWDKAAGCNRYTVKLWSNATSKMLRVTLVIICTRHANSSANRLTTGPSICSQTSTTMSSGLQIFVSIWKRSAPFQVSSSPCHRTLWTTDGSHVMTHVGATLLWWMPFIYSTTASLNLTTRPYSKNRQGIFWIPSQCGIQRLILENLEKKTGEKENDWWWENKEDPHCAESCCSSKENEANNELLHCCSFNHERIYVPLYT